MNLDKLEIASNKLSICNLPILDISLKNLFLTFIAVARGIHSLFFTFYFLGSCSQEPMTRAAPLSTCCDGYRSAPSKRTLCPSMELITPTRMRHTKTFLHCSSLSPLPSIAALQADVCLLDSQQCLLDLLITQLLCI